MYIKRGAWKKAANLTMEMNVLMLEWGVYNLTGRKNRKLFHRVRSHMESVGHDIWWQNLGVGLTKCIQKPKES